MYPQGNTHAILFKLRKFAIQQVSYLEGVLEEPFMPQPVINVYKFKLQLARMDLENIEETIRGIGLHKKEEE